MDEKECANYTPACEKCGNFKATVEKRELITIDYDADHGYRKLCTSGGTWPDLNWAIYDRREYEPNPTQAAFLNPVDRDICLAALRLMEKVGAEETIRIITKVATALECPPKP